MRVPYEWTLASRYLRFHRGTMFLSLITAISTAGVAVGTMALVVALALNAGFVEDVRQRIYSGSAHLTVTSAREPVFDGADPLLADLRAQPGVRAAGPVLHTPAMISAPELEANEYAEVHGVEPRSHGAVIQAPGGADPFAPLAGPAPSGRDGIVLGERLAARLGAFEGDLVRVIVPQVTLSPFTPMPRSRVFEVVGTYRSDHFQQDAQRAYVDIAAARTLLRAGHGTSWVEVRLDDLDRLDAMRDRLRERFAGEWLVIDLIEQNRDLFRALNTEKLLLWLAIGLIVVVAALNIVSTLVLVVNDKVREIGALAAMGARPASVALIFVIQGAAIGACGTGAGLALGAPLAWVLDRYRVIPLNPEVYYLAHVPFSVQPLDLAGVAATALVISLLATIYPAYRAARLDPVEALRYE